MRLPFAMTVTYGMKYLIITLDGTQRTAGMTFN